MNFDPSTNEVASPHAPSAVSTALAAALFVRGPLFITTALWTVFVVLPIPIGLALQRAFDAITSDTGPTVYWLAGAVMATELIRVFALRRSGMYFMTTWIEVQTLLRANMLTGQMASGRPDAGQPVASAGGALTHFREDTEDIASMVDGWTDLVASGLFCVVALVVLASIDVWATMAISLPMVAIVVAMHVLGPMIDRYRRADRLAAQEVGALLGDTMASVVTIKVNGAESNLLGALKARMDKRAVTATRDQVLQDTTIAFETSISDLAFGLVLIVAASRLRSGEITTGDLLVFVAFAGWLSFFPRMAGETLARARRGRVSVDRMRALVANGAPEQLTQRRIARLNVEAPVLSAPDRPVRTPLEHLSVRGLSVEQAGLRNIDVDIARGSLTIVTGPVGSGKSTLLRAIVGLIPVDSGEIRWNSRVLDDVGAFMVPPNASYLSQVPNLLSDSLARNVALGDLPRQQIVAAMHLAVMEDDLADMPDGLDTVIGPRGLRLSGGQRQRVAAARAFVHRSELIVLDDLSSALDVATELTVWEQLAAAGATVLAVSHRQVALDRATTIIRLG
jgi:ATP-binding cassette, subfamily B, bacterial